MWRNFKRLWPYTKGVRKLIVLYATLAVLSGAGSAIIPLITAKEITALTANQLPLLVQYALILFGVAAAWQLLQLFLTTLYYKITRPLRIDIQKHLCREILRLETSEIDKMGTGVFVNRIGRDTTEMASILSRCFDMLLDILPRLAVLFVTLFVSPPFFVLWMTMLAAYMLLRRYRSKVRYRDNKVVASRRETTSGLAAEVIRGARDIKLLDASVSTVNRLADKASYVNEAETKSGIDGAKLSFATNMTEGVFETADIILGVALISLKRLTVPNFIVILSYRDNVRYLVGNTSALFDNIVDFNLAADRVFEVIDNQKFKKEQFGSTKLVDLRGEICFKDVTFAYKADKPVIQNMSFDIKPGSKVAFVGKSGAGKTTILSLVTKLYHRTGGEILIDGVPIDDLDRSSLRDNITAISQNPYIFNFTVRDNLELARPGATLAEIRHACQLAQIDDHIMNLPDKYDSLLGENGVILSGGQKQRLAIARAILKGSKVILFDEATSALDNETQAKISRAIDSLSGDHTLVIVAHRLSTVMNADKIYVVDKGCIAASGTHKELLASSPIYSELYAGETE